MPLKLYRKSELPDLEVEDRHLALARRYELEIEAGWHPLIAVLEKVFPRLTSNEFDIWYAFFQCNYCDRCSTWGELDYRKVPLEVLEELDQIDDSGYFDGYEIWCTESDVHWMLVGVVGDHDCNTDEDTLTEYFMIARWGAMLPDYDLVASEVRQKQR